MERRDFLVALAITPMLSSELFASTDVYLSREEFATLTVLNKRLRNLRRFVGFANFNLLSYPQALKYAKSYSRIGEFTKAELLLIDRLFHENPANYGFYGAKTCNHIENFISSKDVNKIPHTGHYLYKGKSQKDYNNVIKDVGDTLILTSGVRNVMKQLSLYANKIYRTGGNMTKATTSIAPPAYSYHTISDFDVGKKHWGYKNFTSKFARTNEFKKMRQLDYIGMRYIQNNKDGVRFEPWHVEVI